MHLHTVFLFCRIYICIIAVRNQNKSYIEHSKQSTQQLWSIGKDDTSTDLFLVSQPGCWAFYNLLHMRNQEDQKEQDQKLLSFAPLLLNALQRNDIGRFKEAHDFFKEAFVLLTDHDMFEDIDYRLKWTGYISFFENISTPLEGYSSEEIETAINTAILILTKRKEDENEN